MRYIIVGKRYLHICHVPNSIILCKQKNYLILFLYYTPKIQNKYHQDYLNINLYNVTQQGMLYHIIYNLFYNES